jgi:hypothetical protein
VLVDPHDVYPFDLRCEKLDGPQVAILRRTGLAELILPAGTPYREAWIARFGRVVEKHPEEQYGVLYDTLVNAARRAIPATGWRSSRRGVRQRSIKPRGAPGRS